MTRKKNLTRRQADVLQHIRGYIEEHDISPTLGEIGEGLGVNRVTVFEHVRALESKGWIQTQAHLSRSIELVGDESEPNGIPILGRIAAGQPIDVVPEAERDVFEFGEFFRADSDVYMLQVEGESMIDDQIRDGDYVLVESRAHAQSGETVVALVRDQEATLKRYHPMGAQTRLEPRNATMESIVVPTSEVRIQGVVVGVIRRY
ncbi:MAG: repressor LexA [Deltaproteobacteria bacterium]|nr:repressor LexA [Deltaproteobacteria bacterium]